MKKQPKPVSPYMTIKEVADFFRVSYSSTYHSYGVFARLRRVTINRRVMVLREDVEELDRQLQASARAVEEQGRLLYKKRRGAS